MRDFWRRHQKGLIFLSLGLTACQAAGNSSTSCSQTNAISSGSAAKTNLLGGGVLTIEGLAASPSGEGQRAAAQCSAFVRVISKMGDTYKAQIWTARHCLPDYSSRILRSDLFVYDGRTGYAAVDAQFPLAEARNNFFNVVEREVPAFSDPEKRQKTPARLVLELAFLEEEGKKNYGDDCRIVAGLSTSNTSETRLCSALQDLRIFDATLKAKSKAGERILSTLNNSQSSSTDPSIKQWRDNVKTLLDYELDISRGRFVDIVLNCEDTAPSAACQYKTTLQTLARKFRAPGRDLLSEAEKDGFTSPTRSYSDFKKQIAQTYYNDKIKPLFESLNDKIQSGSLKLIFAANFADESGKSRQFASAPLNDFYTATNSILQFQFFTRPESRDAFLQFESPKGKSLALSSGDSGSVLMLDDSTPFLVISAKGQKSISGGASILALPVATEEEPTAIRSSTRLCKN